MDQILQTKLSEIIPPALEHYGQRVFREWGEWQVTVEARFQMAGVDLANFQEPSEEGAAPPPWPMFTLRIHLQNLLPSQLPFPVWIFSCVRWTLWCKKAR